MCMHHSQLGLTLRADLGEIFGLCGDARGARAMTDEQGQVGDMASKAPRCEIIVHETYEP
jgi:hypothetical protein